MDLASKAHAFVDDLETLDLAAGDRHHLERVLRVRAGDDLTVSDGAGRWRRCRFGVPLEAAGPIETDARPEPAITVAFAVLKGDRNEWIAQKLTEIGVDRIVPFVADRTIARWDAAKTARHHERLVTVAREAAMQSRRSWLPAVEPVGVFEQVAGRPGAVLADHDGVPPALARPVVLIGPEGGWSDAERRVGLPRMTLGSTVLRAETAAIVAASALCGLRSALFESQSRHGG